MILGKTWLNTHGVLFDILHDKLIFCSGRCDHDLPTSPITSSASPEPQESNSHHPRSAIQTGSTGNRSTTALLLRPLDCYQFLASRPRRRCARPSVPEYSHFYRDFRGGSRQSRPSFPPPRLVRPPSGKCTLPYIRRGTIVEAKDPWLAVF
jgi:hypothetical protein